MDGLEQRMASLETRQDRLENELQEVKEVVFRLEDSQSQDVYARKHGQKTRRKKF
jgi:chaperonin cofactor prefoldin